LSRNLTVRIRRMENKSLKLQLPDALDFGSHLEG
jgi:hypothetical protein